MDTLRESAQKIVTAFRAVSKLECAVIDLTAMGRVEPFNPFCEMCERLQVERFGRAACEDMVRFACYQSERWGGKYEWLCPAGLTFINTMVSKGQTQKLGICAGPFLMTDLKEFMADDLMAFLGGSVPAGLRAQAKKIPYIECSRVSSFADVLCMLAAYAAERDSIELRIMEQIAESGSEQFSRIADLKNGTQDSRYPIESEKALQTYIAQGDRHSAQKVLNEILGNVFFCSGGNFDVIKARITELVVLLSRAAIEGGADVVSVFGLNYDYLQEINGFRTLDELNNWLANVLIRFTNSVFDLNEVRHSDIILGIIEYIRQNYMRKISLNEISENVNFSVSYISRIFKEEMGRSITGFINMVRVDNAKMMLLRKEIPLVEVAYLCGFEDQTYFNKVFKKLVGVSPGKYRDHRGKLRT